MPRLDNSTRERAIGMLQAGATQVDVARRYNVARITIYRLWQRYLTTNTTADRPRSGRPRVTTPRHDRFIRLCHLRNRFETPSHTASVIPGMRRISPRTVRRRLAEAGLRARRPYRGPMLTQRHRQQRLEWSRRHLRWTIRDWQEVLFTDESRFTLRHADGRVRVYRRSGERYSDPCVLRHDRFGGWKRYGVGRNCKKRSHRTRVRQWNTKRSALSRTNPHSTRVTFYGSQRRYIPAGQRSRPRRKHQHQLPTSTERECVTVAGSLTRSLPDRASVGPVRQTSEETTSATRNVGGTCERFTAGVAAYPHGKDQPPDSVYASPMPGYNQQQGVIHPLLTL